MKFISRKFILMTLLFVAAQVFKWNGKIDDLWWFAASVVGTFGYSALQLYFRSKAQAGSPDPIGGEK